MSSLIMLPDETRVTFSKIRESLLDDNIKLLYPNEEIMSYLSRYYKVLNKKIILSNRYKSIEEISKYLDIKLSDIIKKDFIYKYLPEVEQASNIINKHIRNNSRILLVHDSDTDGITSAAIAYKILTKLYNYLDIEVVINKRKYGNGINDQLSKEIIDIYKDRKFDLLITGDHGSHDRKNLTMLKEKLNIDVVVTDHHLYKEEEAPFNMDAFVNPQIHKNDFKDVTGAGIIYFTLVYSFLKYKDNITIKEYDYIYYLLTYVGLTIISDFVNVGNFINRKILINVSYFDYISSKSHRFLS